MRLNTLIIQQVWVTNGFGTDSLYLQLFIGIHNGSQSVRLLLLGSMVQCHHRLPCWLWCASLYVCCGPPKHFCLQQFPNCCTCNVSSPPLHDGNYVYDLLPGCPVIVPHHSLEMGMKKVQDMTPIKLWQLYPNHNSFHTTHVMPEFLHSLVLSWATFYRVSVTCMSSCVPCILIWRHWTKEAWTPSTYLVMVSSSLVWADWNEHMIVFIFSWPAFIVALNSFWLTSIFPWLALTVALIPDFISSWPAHMVAHLHFFLDSTNDGLNSSWLASIRS